ncbi:MAG TPA: hypothetical protein VIC55_00155 [Gemmatimonadaceae bacterium]|jgi:hypothetical protein
MRTVRWMTSGLALVALLPAVGAAQSSRPFQDSWFWGAKAGLMTFSTTTVSNHVAPTFGIDMLVTRNKGGLYISGEQDFFNTTSAVQDNTGNNYRVAIHDMRRYTAAAMAFPVNWGGLRPYAGIGFSMNLIQHIGLIDQPVDPLLVPQVTSQMDNQKDRISFVAIGGLQAAIKNFSLFGQVTYMPSAANFLLNGRATYMLEGGIRYNFGTSVDRPD